MSDEKKMRRCDLFYRKAMERENWNEDNLCDPPTEPREAIHVLIEELLGENWYVVMPENGDQVITNAVYAIIKKYVDEPKRENDTWMIIVFVLTIINIIIFFIHG